MRFAKGIVLVLCGLLIVIQFIRPSRNQSKRVMATDISKVLTMPDTVLTLLKKACYDCHSNSTDYPWYSNVQPMGWLMAYHINHAKNQLNFSDFGSYSNRRQLSKLDGIVNSLKDDIMPLKSYKIMHKSAQLSKDEKLLLINWAEQSVDSLSTMK